MTVQAMPHDQGAEENDTGQGIADAGGHERRQRLHHDRDSEVGRTPDDVDDRKRERDLPFLGRSRRQGHRRIVPGFGATIGAVNPARRIGLGVALVVAVVLLLLVVFGLGPFEGEDASASAPPSPSAEPTSSAEASATESAKETVSASTSPAPPADAWTCDAPVTLEASSSDVVHTADVRVGTHPGYDRIAFEYLEDDSPAFEIHPTTPPFTQDASGLPMTVSGTGLWRSSWTAATKSRGRWEPDVHRPDVNFEPGFPYYPAHRVEVISRL